MKKLIGTGMVLGAAFLMMSAVYGGRIKVYIVNKCSSDVKYRVESPGSATSYTAYDKSKSPQTFMEGTKIYNSDGKMVHEVTSSSEGKEVIVCD